MKHEDGLTVLQLATGADNLETIKILLKGASNEGILDIVADIIERYHDIRLKWIFQFLVEVVGLATCCLPPGLEAPAEVQSPAIAVLPRQEQVVCHHH